MDCITNMCNAVDFIENHLTEKLDYNHIAKQAYFSGYYFQRVFSVLCGCTLGEYIRKRRLSRAGDELSAGAKVIDVALKYCYESPDSFARAFLRFHGVLPSEAAKGAPLKSFSRIILKKDTEGGSVMDYRIEKKPKMRFIALKKKFEGDVGERNEQSYDFWISTRKEQDILLQVREGEEAWYDISMNFSDEGFDQYIAVKSLIKEIPESFSQIIKPEKTYAVFGVYPLVRNPEDFIDLRKRIFTEWLPESEYTLENSAEIEKIHWRKEPRRYLEIWLPVKRT